MVADRPEPPETSHEWISFVVEGVTWLFDVTFLTSNWNCIWGNGCPGVRTGPAPELGEGCCSYGAHTTDEADRARVEERALALADAQWQYGARARELGGPFTTDDDGDVITHTVDDACIFLNRPDFAGGAGCALHIGAVDAGEAPHEWKPDVCWQLPLRLEEHVDDNGGVLMVLREWSRNDWGGGGADFHWWCTEDDLAFAAHHAVYETLATEIDAMVGPTIAAMLTDHLDRRPVEQLLPHPSVRRSS